MHAVEQRHNRTLPSLISPLLHSIALLSKRAVFLFDVATTRLHCASERGFGPDEVPRLAGNSLRLSHSARTLEPSARRSSIG